MGIIFLIIQLSNPVFLFKSLPCFINAIIFKISKQHLFLMMIKHWKSLEHCKHILYHLVHIRCNYRIIWFYYLQRKLHTSLVDVLNLYFLKQNIVAMLNQNIKMIHQIKSKLNFELELLLLSQQSHFCNAVSSCPTLKRIRLLENKHCIIKSNC